MEHSELRDLEHDQWLHAHFQGQSRDCDGPMTHGHTTWLAQLTEGVVPDDSFADLGFDAVLLGFSSSFGGGGYDGPTQIECGINDEGEKYISFHQQTDEGYRSGRYDYCHDRLCHESESQGPWQRDHYAEAMGY